MRSIFSMARVAIGFFRHLTRKPIQPTSGFIKASPSFDRRMAMRQVVTRGSFEQLELRFALDGTDPIRLPLSESVQVSGITIAPSQVMVVGEYSVTSAQIDGKSVLVSTDGDGQGLTVLWEDHLPETYLGDRIKLVQVVGNKLYFVADEALQSIYETDGTLANTRLVVANSRIRSLPLPEIVPFAGGICYSTREHFSYMMRCAAPGVTDGDQTSIATPPGQKPGTGSQRTWSAELNGRIITANDELVSTSGDVDSSMFLSSAQDVAATTPLDLKRVGNLVYFTGTDKSHGRELWVSDGTANGTHFLTEFKPGPADGLASADADGEPNALWSIGNTLIVHTSSAMYRIDSDIATRIDFDELDQHDAHNVLAPIVNRDATGFWFVVQYRNQQLQMKSVIYESDGTRTGTRAVRALTDTFTTQIMSIDDYLYYVDNNQLLFLKYGSTQSILVKDNFETEMLSAKHHQICFVLRDDLNQYSVYQVNVGSQLPVHVSSYSTFYGNAQTVELFMHASNGIVLKTSLVAGRGISSYTQVNFTTKSTLLLLPRQYLMAGDSQAPQAVGEYLMVGRKTVGGDRSLVVTSASNRDVHVLALGPNDAEFHLSFLTGDQIVSYEKSMLPNGKDLLFSLSLTGERQPLYAFANTASTTYSLSRIRQARRLDNRWVVYTTEYHANNTVFNHEGLLFTDGTVNGTFHLDDASLSKDLLKVGDYVYGVTVPPIELRTSTLSLNRVDLQTHSMVTLRDFSLQTETTSGQVNELTWTKTPWTDQWLLQLWYRGTRKAYLVDIAVGTVNQLNTNTTIRSSLVKLNDSQRLVLGENAAARAWLIESPTAPVTFFDYGVWRQEFDSTDSQVPSGFSEVGGTSTLGSNGTAILASQGDELHPIYAARLVDMRWGQQPEILSHEMSLRAISESIDFPITTESGEVIFHTHSLSVAPLDDSQRILIGKLDFFDGVNTRSISLPLGPNALSPRNESLPIDRQVTLRYVGMFAGQYGFVLRNEKELRVIFTDGTQSGTQTLAIAQTDDFSVYVNDPYRDLSLTAKTDQILWFRAQDRFFTVLLKDVVKSPKLQMERASIAEGSLSGTNAGFVSLYGLSGATATLRLTDDAGGLFRLQGSEVTYSGSPPLLYQPAYHVIKVSAEVNGTLVAEQAFTISVIDAPPPAPVDIDSTANEFDVNVRAGGVGIRLQANDIGTSSVRYFLVDDNDSRFAINSETGEVRLSDSSRKMVSGQEYSIIAKAIANGMISKGTRLTIKATGVSHDDFYLDWLQAVAGIPTTISINRLAESPLPLPDNSISSYKFAPPDGLKADEIWVDRMRKIDNFIYIVGQKSPGFHFADDIFFEGIGYSTPFVMRVDLVTGTSQELLMEDYSGRTSGFSGAVNDIEIKNGTIEFFGSCELGLRGLVPTRWTLSGKPTQIRFLPLTTEYFGSIRDASLDGVMVGFSTAGPTVINNQTAAALPIDDSFDFPVIAQTISQDSQILLGFESDPFSMFHGIAWQKQAGSYQQVDYLDDLYAPTGIVVNAHTGSFIFGHQQLMDVDEFGEVVTTQPVAVWSARQGQVVSVISHPDMERDFDLIPIRPHAGGAIAVMRSKALSSLMYVDAERTVDMTSGNLFTDTEAFRKYAESDNGFFFLFGTGPQFELREVDELPIVPHYTVEVDWNQDGTVDLTNEGDWNVEITHTFNQPGRYPVRFTIKSNSGEILQIADTIIVVVDNQSFASGRNSSDFTWNGTPVADVVAVVSSVHSIAVSDAGGREDADGLVSAAFDLGNGDDKLTLTLGGLVTAIDGGAGVDEIQFVFPLEDGGYQRKGENEATLHGVERVALKTPNGSVSDEFAIQGVGGEVRIRSIGTHFLQIDVTNASLIQLTDWTLRNSLSSNGRNYFHYVGNEFELLTNVQVQSSAFRPEDVSLDGHVTALDALLVINYLNQGLQTVVQPGVNDAFDVSGNGFITALDALLIINHLNSHVGGSEGEACEQIATPIGHDAPPVEWQFTGLLDWSELKRVWWRRA